jgi:uncharacterized membrane protein
MGVVNINLHLLLSLFGYLGAVLLLGSFAATSRGRMSTGSRRYHLANLVGGAALLVSCVAQAAWPSVGVNLVWMAISLLTLAQAAHVRAGAGRHATAAHQLAADPERSLQHVA